MPTPLVVIGAGGFGREVLDVVEAINALATGPRFDLLGVLDDSVGETFLERLVDRGISYLGTTAAWLAAAPEAQYLIGIGNPQIRRRIDVVLSKQGLRPAVALHPTAGVGSRCAIGAGTVVCGGAQISTNVRLGRHVHINPSATIGHDSVLEDFVSINPSATISGACWLENEAYIGSSSVVLQGLRVGAGAIVGAAACVVRDVRPAVTVVGVPAHEVEAV